MNIIEESEKYIKANSTTFSIYTEDFWALRAVKNATESYKSGNFGIGAVLLYPLNGKIYIFDGQNKTINATLAERFYVHAETECLTRFMNFLEKHGEPSEIIEYDESKITDSQFIKEKQITIIGTLEPCMKCHVEMIQSIGIFRSWISKNATILSISNIKDGDLVERKGIKISSGAAFAFGEKSILTPLEWLSIQVQGENAFLKFRLSKLADKKISELSHDLFYISRERILKIMREGIENKID